MNEVIERLNKISRLVEVVTIILMVFASIAIVAMVAVLIMTLAVPDLVLDIIEQSGETATIGMLQASFLAGLVAAALINIVLHYVRRLFSGIRKDNTPFTDKCVKELEMIAILIVVCTLVLPIVGAALSYYFDMSAVFVFSPLTLFMAFVVYFLSLVFKYGASLQKESDATL